MSVRPSPAVVAPVSRFMHATPALLVGLSVLLAGLPAEETGLEAMVAPLGVGVLFGALSFLTLRLRHLLATSLVLIFAVAYAVGTGEATVRGRQLAELSAGPGAVWAALGLLFLFVTVLVVGVWMSTRAFSGGFVAVTRRIESFWQQDDVVHVGTLLLLLLSFLVSVQTGAWSTYGGEVTEIRDGAFRIEFFYDPALLSEAALLVSELLKTYGRPRSGRRRAFLAVLLGVVSLLLFARQMRRLMLAAGIVGLGMAFDHPVIGRRLLASPRRLLTWVALVAALGIGANTVSMVWRASSADFGTNDVGERLADVGSRMGGDPGDMGDRADVGRATKNRLTYLAMDALSVEYAPVVSDRMRLGELMSTTLILYTPKMFFRDKYLYPQVTCEAAFLDLGVNIDLPCTPQTEGFLAAGAWGVLLVALSWAPFLALGEHLVRRRHAMGIVAAMHLFYPFILVETSAFPFVQGVRLAVLGVAAVGLLGGAWTVVRSVMPGGHGRAPIA